jgi:hypothetical protein
MTKIIQSLEELHSLLQEDPNISELIFSENFDEPIDILPETIKIIKYGKLRKN